MILSVFSIREYAIYAVVEINAGIPKKVQPVLAAPEKDDVMRGLVEFLLEARPFTGAFTQEEQARAANLIVPFNNHFVDAR